MSELLEEEVQNKEKRVLKPFYRGQDIIECGVDDAARGPLFGRVYTAAVILDPTIELHQYLNDSKKVTPKRRKLVREWIEDNAIAYSVSWRDEKRIDKINIVQATMESMHESIRNLGVDPELILVDGDYFRPYYQDMDNLVEHKTVVEGDSHYASIAAASILAKEYHDDYILELCDQNEYLDNRYGLRKNKGYGTELHRWGLRTYGPSPYHRLTFLKNIKPIDTQNQEHS